MFKSGKYEEINSILYLTLLNRVRGMVSRFCSLIICIKECYVVNYSD